MAIVSGDDHLDMHTLPPTMFVERISPEFRDRAPRVVETPEGRFWEVDGARLGGSGRQRSTLGMMAGPGDDGFRPSTPSKRLQDMERDGVYCSVIYGPLRFPMKDPLLKFAMLRALNDFMMEFNAEAPERLVALPYLPPHDGTAAAGELNRVAKKGARGALLHFFEWTEKVFNSKLPQAWDPLWAAANELRMPISVHLGGGSHTVGRGEPTTWVVQGYASVAPSQLDEALIVMVLSGTLERHPNMKLVLGESGIGWIRYMVERMDRTMDTHGHMVKDVKLKQKPSETFEKQVYATFESDMTGLAQLPFGENQYMWAADYPHANGTFPHSRDFVKKMANTLTPAQTQKLFRDNAARLYNIKGVPAGVPA